MSDAQKWSDEMAELRAIGPHAMMLARMLHAAARPDTALEADIEKDDFWPNPDYVTQALTLLKNNYLADRFLGVIDGVHKLRAYRAERQERNRQMSDAMAFAMHNPLPPLIPPADAKEAMDRLFPPVIPKRGNSE